ncbi:serine hydrolase [Chitinophaga nivalis]|uniref:Serine hydrolase n=1 Tax=Chitinophaga nivalis TaxID=2991709 RepID=A0ABT3IM11_9BACT|nr:serine hydrolase [Chitinophaga nivalis]MCW3465301.1 serine hydrolase [Chitinophaga nivalis]MCW3485007.1 serine hydrolase [Chitinophaga nivalis]
MKRILLICISCLIACFRLYSQSPADTVIARLQTHLPALMARDHIPGMGAAYIHQGAVVWSGVFGVLHAGTKAPVTDATLFEAASLTKVVTAYAALQLIDAGLLDPDVPLYTYLGNHYDIGDDPRIQLITTRRVLSHTAGFPNWRQEKDTLLPIHFTPGDHFSYSGEGFVYLAKVMEKITGQPLGALIAQKVFVPLHMTHSSMQYDSTQRGQYAWRHNWLGKPTWLPDYTGINAAASLRTTAADYARFLAAILNGTGLQPATHRLLLTEQIKVDTIKQPQLAWGMGIGLARTPDARYAWHWGDQGDSKAYFAANIATRDAVLYFTNSANGLSIAGDLCQLTIGGEQGDHIRWVEYGKYDPAVVALLTAIQDNGAAAALKAYQRQRTHVIGEEPLNTLGYYLLQNNNLPAAVAVFTQNTQDYPNSGNTWDSLAEALLKQGKKQLAMQHYEKSLQLDPENRNAADQIKRLKETLRKK